MATVYLHIGAPKTATSTLQSVLAANYGGLLRGGVLYPQRCRHGDKSGAPKSAKIRDLKGRSRLGH